MKGLENGGVRIPSLRHAYLESTTCKMRTLDTLEFPRKFARFMMAMEVESVLR
jgi:hypothetical protein